MAKGLVAGLLIFAFLGIIVLSLHFVRSIHVHHDISGNRIVHREHFAVGPTRAAECRCLPGYVPAKKRNHYVCQSLNDMTKTRKCY